MNHMVSTTLLRRSGLIILTLRAPEAIAEAKERTRALGPEGAELVDTDFTIECSEGNSWSVVSQEV